jgi:hypothetical protein
MKGYNHIEVRTLFFENLQLLLELCAFSIFTLIYLSRVFTKVFLCLCKTYIVDHSYPLTTKKKKKTTLHTKLKQNKTNLVQDIKGGCSPRPIFKKENTFCECLIV